MNAKTVIILILVAIAIILIFQNTEVVTFKILLWDVTMSRIVWLLIVLVIGFVAGYLAGTLGRSGSKS